MKGAAQTTDAPTSAPDSNLGPRSTSTDESMSYEHNPEASELRVDCPYITPADGYPELDPNCNLPYGGATVLVGQAAVDFADENSISSGDLVTVKLQASAQHRRRMQEAGNGTESTDNDAYVTHDLLNFTIVARSEQKEVYTGTKIELRHVLCIVDLSDCKKYNASLTWTNFWTKQTLRDAIFGGKGVNPVPNWYKTCSYDKTGMTEANTVIVQVSPSCTPPSAGSGSYNSSKFCTNPEVSSWEDACGVQAKLEAVTDAQINATMKWTARRRLMVLHPDNPICSDPGLAEVTCTSPVCHARSKSRPDFHLAIHELMHNHGLRHSGYIDPTTNIWDPYGDRTDVMGKYVVGSGPLCLGPGSMYRIGWAKHISDPPRSGGGVYGNLTAGNFTRSNTLKGLSLPAPGTADDNMITVALGAASKDNSATVDRHQPIFYLVYRITNATLQGYDAGLPANYSSKVIIYNYTGWQPKDSFAETVFDPSSSGRGLVQTLMDYGSEKAGKGFVTPFNKTKTNVWRSAWVDITTSTTGVKLGGALQVTVVSTGATDAVVDLCRVTSKTGKEINCTDGQDDDCDGLVDSMDPDCA